MPQKHRTIFDIPCYKSTERFFLVYFEQLDSTRKQGKAEKTAIWTCCKLSLRLCDIDATLVSLQSKQAVVCQLSFQMVGRITL